MDGWCGVSRTGPAPTTPPPLAKPLPLAVTHPWPLCAKSWPCHHAQVGERPKAQEWVGMWQQQVRAVSHHQNELRTKGPRKDTVDALRRAEQARRDLEASLHHI